MTVARQDGLKTQGVRAGGGAPPPRAGAMTMVRRGGSVLVDNRPVLLLVLIALLIASMAYLYPYSFPTAANGRAVLLTAAQSGILVVGMMLLMIGGTFDLSVGSILALSGVASAVLDTGLGAPTVVAVAGGLALGALSGLLNGLIVTKVRISALIATLAMAGVLCGVTQLISGTGVGFIGPDFAKIGQSTWLGPQSPFVIMIVVAAVGSPLVAKTRFFRQYYFVGSNSRAARLSGMRPERPTLLAFVIMGALAGVAGVLGSRAAQLRCSERRNRCRAPGDHCSRPWRRDAERR